MSGSAEIAGGSGHGWPGVTICGTAAGGPSGGERGRLLHRHSARGWPRTARPGPALPHRHQANPRPNPRDHARVRPADPHHQMPPSGELLRDLTLDPTRNYQPTGHPPGTPPTPQTQQPRTLIVGSGPFRCLATSQGAAYRNRTDDLRITSAFSCVARGLKPRASFKFTGCC